MPVDMDGLENVFDDIIASSEGESGDDFQFDELSQNATIHTGDDEDAEIIVGEPDEDEADEELDEADEDTENPDDDESEDDDATEDEAFDFDSVKDQLVTITVKGETTRVPLAELRNGYMRQADYTKKTQQIAADMGVVNWAKEMQTAFTNDPAGTIRALQEHFGLLDDDSSDDYENLDPEVQPLAKAVKDQQKEMARLRQEISQERERSAQAQLDADVKAELNLMKSTYEDFDPQVVLPIAIEEGVSMAKAYKLWKADQVLAQQANPKVKAKAEQAAATREKAKSAAKQISKGTSSKRAVADDKWKTFDDFESLFTHEVENSK